MISSAAKLLFGLAATALVLGIGSAFAVDDPAAVLALISVFGLFALLGLALTASGFSDYAPRYDATEDRPPLAMTTVSRSQTPRPSSWPVVAALATGMLGLGLALGAPLVFIGVVLGLMAAAGWLAQAWRSDPSFTPREGARISQRFLSPLGLPLLALGLVAVIVVSVSRVLLALSKNGSVVVAFLLALVVIVAFFAIASRPRLGRGPMVALGGAAVAALVTAGGVSAASGYRTFEQHGPAGAESGPVSVEARGIKFVQPEITVTQNQITMIKFKNLDPTYHNIAVYSSATGGIPFWNGEPIKGVNEITYTHDFTMPPGTYSFRCDFHPAMTGTFVVKAAP